MINGESSKHIVPLVLPTQLESDDSDSKDDKTENRNTLPYKDINIDEDIDGDEGAGSPRIDITTHSNNHLKEKGSKKVCHCTMRREINV
jgi:hypothetical protein